jgi:hypothetical protein
MQILGKDTIPWITILWSRPTESSSALVDLHVWVEGLTSEL